VTSSVIFVAEVARSVEFYCGLLACTAVIHDRDAALLVGPEGFQIYLIQRGHRAPNHSGGIGLQCLIWAVDSADELTDLEQALRSLGIRTDRDISGGVTFVTGRDPDGIRTGSGRDPDGIRTGSGRDPDGIRIMVAHPSPEELPRSVVDARLYS
jgi:hypothetical protein